MNSLFIRKMMLLSGIAMITSTGASVHGEGSSCPRCDDIREYNKTHMNNCEYYEDYLKEQQEKKGSSAPAPNASETPKTNGKAKAPVPLNGKQPKTNNVKESKPNNGTSTPSNGTTKNTK